MRKEVLKFRDKISQLVFHQTLECGKKKVFKRGRTFDRQIDTTSIVSKTEPLLF